MSLGFDSDDDFADARSGSPTFTSAPADADIDTEMAPAEEDEYSGTPDIALNDTPATPDAPALPPLEWKAGQFPLLCGNIAKHLNAVNTILRENRLAIRQTDPKDLESGWMTVLPTLACLNATVQLVSESYEHVSLVSCKISDDLEALKSVLGRDAAAPAPPLEPFRYSPSPQNSPPPRRAPTPAPPSLLSRLGTKYASRSPSPAYTDESFNQSRPSTPFATPMSHYDDGSTRGRSPARANVKRPPRNASRLFFVVFPDEVRPRPDSRPPPAILKNVFSGFLEHDPQFRSFTLETAEWGSGGNLTFVLSSPPSDAVMSLFRERAISLFNVPSDMRGKVVARRFEYRVHMGIKRVPCVTRDPVTGTVKTLEIPEITQSLLKDPEWKLVLERAGSVVRWGTQRLGDTARMLVVEFIDDSVYSAAHRLQSRKLTVFGNPLRARILQDKITTPQCTYCWIWGHPGSSCNSAVEVCARCGDNHNAYYHNTVAKCCADRPDRETVPCSHPPRCRNCFGPHYANDHRLCPYAKHRNDRSWYNRQPGPVLEDLPAPRGPIATPADAARNYVASASSNMNAERTDASGSSAANKARVRFGPATVLIFDANLPPQNTTAATGPDGARGRQDSGRGGHGRR